MQDKHLLISELKLSPYSDTEEKILESKQLILFI